MSPRPWPHRQFPWRPFIDWIVDQALLGRGPAGVSFSGPALVQRLDTSIYQQFISTHIGRVTIMAQFPMFSPPYHQILQGTYVRLLFRLQGSDQWLDLRR